MKRAHAVLEPRSLFAERYRVETCLQQGGMGAVYAVVDERTERRRALKVMLPNIVSDPDLRARFRLEATIAAGIESEHIVETFDAGVDEPTGMPFLVMELLRGDDLGATVRRAGRLRPPHVVRLLHQVALALDKTHAANIVHRDLKPENLFVTRRDDGTERVKILDFGIAKVIAQSTGAAQTRSIGSPMYMAPEQIRGEARIDGRADLYSLAQIAYTLLVGRPYWEPEMTRAESVYPFMMKVLQGTPEAPSARAAPHGVELPFAFDAWFRKATALVVDTRYSHATTLIGAMADALGVPRIPIAIESAGGHLDDVTVSAPAHAVSAKSSEEEGSLPTPVEPAGRTTGAVVSQPQAATARGGAVAIALGAAVALAAVVGVTAWATTVWDGRSAAEQGSTAAERPSIRPSDAAQPGAAGSGGDERAPTVSPKPPASTVESAAPPPPASASTSPAAASAPTLPTAAPAARPGPRALPVTAAGAPAPAPPPAATPAAAAPPAPAQPPPTTPTARRDPLDDL